jgi:hypothetical protein
VLARGTIREMRLLFALAVFVGAMGGCSSFGATDSVDAGAGTELDAGSGDAASDGATLDAAPVVDSGPIEGVPPGGKLVFVSTATSHPPGPTNSFVAFADAACTSEGAAAGRAGNYVAWVATAAQSAVGRLPTDGTWYLRNGVRIAEFAIFENGAIQRAIDRDAMGRAALGADHAVWTGTIFGGSTTAAETCSNWSSSLGSGEVGDWTQAGAKWASSGGRNCAQDARFYCFEK